MNAELNAELTEVAQALEEAARYLEVAVGELLPVSLAPCLER